MKKCMQCQTNYYGFECPKCGTRSWENESHNSSMYRVGIRGHFDAAHHLRGYDGACARQHGHSWVVEVAVESQYLDSLGMVVDFRLLKGTLKSKVLDILDHRDINEIDIFTEINPTAENLARWIYEKMREGGPMVIEVKVWESPESWASYSKA